MASLIPSTRARRRDAEERRQALLNAAEACFHEQGYGVPLELVAERAGVGRGTLYRNFEDRGALALAIFAREIDRLAAAIDAGQPIAETIAILVREGARASALFVRVAAELRLDTERFAAFRALRTRLEDVLAPAVTRARARGELAGDIAAADLVLAMRMAGGLLHPAMDAAEHAELVEAGLALLLRGLQPR